MKKHDSESQAPVMREWKSFLYPCLFHSQNRTGGEEMYLKFQRLPFFRGNVKVDNITCYLSGVQAQTWQPMNSLLMDGQEEGRKKRFSTVGPFWSCGFFFFLPPSSWNKFRFSVPTWKWALWDTKVSLFLNPGCWVFLNSYNIHNNKVHLNCYTMLWNGLCKFRKMYFWFIL